LAHAQRAGPRDNRGSACLINVRPLHSWLRRGNGGAHHAGRGAKRLAATSANPFGYNVGIAYETDTSIRPGQSIPADLAQINQYFKLIRTYHDTVQISSPQCTMTPVLDPGEARVIQYLENHQAANIPLTMGTDDSAIAIGTTGIFAGGLMDCSSYTDAWVAMLVKAFGNTGAVQQSVKAILLGNELDNPGPYVPDPSPRTQTRSRPD
jgi:hypothetical protein